jgi:deoxyribose-phosphate aldolase
MQEIPNTDIERLLAAVDYSEALTITAGEKDAREACEFARRYGFRAVVAFPQYIGVLADELAGSGVLAQIPVGFPCGGHSTAVKCREAEEGLERGATDLDMVMNISAFKAGRYTVVADEIREILKLTRPRKVPTKVIIEIGALTDQEIVDAAMLVKDSGADFIKTCTGFGPGRVSIHAIRLIKGVVGDATGIKASGGVASISDGVAFRHHGADVVALRKKVVDQLEAMNWPVQ